jgi:hypothetical protein
MNGGNGRSKQICTHRPLCPSLYKTVSPVVRIKHRISLLSQYRFTRFHCQFGPNHEWTDVRMYCRQICTHRSCVLPYRRLFAFIVSFCHILDSAKYGWLRTVFVKATVSFLDSQLRGSSAGLLTFRGTRSNQQKNKKKEELNFFFSDPMNLVRVKLVCSQMCLLSKIVP